MSTSGGFSEIGQAPTMFQSAVGRERYFAAYDAMLARWPSRVHRALVEILGGG